MFSTNLKSNLITETGEQKHQKNTKEKGIKKK